MRSGPLSTKRWQYIKRRISGGRLKKWARLGCAILDGEKWRFKSWRRCSGVLTAGFSLVVLNAGLVP